MTLDEGHYKHLLFVATTYGKEIFVALENSGFFSPTLWPPCCWLISP